MRAPTLLLAVLSPLVAACAPQPFLEVWEWEDTACDQAPCWGRIMVVGNEVTYERDGDESNSGSLTDYGQAELELGLMGLCSPVDEEPGDRMVSVLLDCEGEARWHSYDKDAPPDEVAGLEALMADVMLSLQNCRPRESTMPDHGCDRMQ